MKAGERYHTLDGMRGVAALVVAAYHLELRFHGSSIAGYLAVDLFFALSGFVIALNYTKRFADNLTILRFVELRLIRLLPLYILGLVLSIAKLATAHMLHIPIPASIGSPTCAVASAAFMLPDPCSFKLFPLNGPSWSLFFEVLINIAFAVFLWRCSARVLVVLMAAAALSFFLFISRPDYFNVGWAWYNIHGGAARTIFSFCAGILIYRLLPLHRRTLSYAALLPVAAMLAIIGITTPAAYRASFEIAFVVCAFPVMVMAGCMLELPSVALRKVFGFFGDLSYPIYATHFPLIAIVLPIAAKFHLSAYLSAAAFLICLVPAAYVAAELDKVVRARISTALKVRRTAAPQII